MTDKPQFIFIIYVLVFVMQEQTPVKHFNGWRANTLQWNTTDSVWWRYIYGNTRLVWHQTGIYRIVRKYMCFKHDQWLVCDRQMKIREMWLHRGDRYEGEKGDRGHQATTTKRVHQATTTDRVQHATTTNKLLYATSVVYLDFTGVEKPPPGFMVRWAALQHVVIV